MRVRVFFILLHLSHVNDDVRRGPMKTSLLSSFSGASGCGQRNVARRPKTRVVARVFPSRLFFFALSLKFLSLGATPFTSSGSHVEIPRPLKLNQPSRVVS